MKRPSQKPNQMPGQIPGRKQEGKPKKPQGSVRIIGGQWRGRRVPVPDIEGLRPSGDRCRETLFNWLQPFLHNAKCVDLFAGTGVMGLEAVSRGAASAVLVEKSRVAANSLRQSVEMLEAKDIAVIEADALSWLAQQAPSSMDIVFVDPPFALNMADRGMAEQGMAEKVMASLAQTQALRLGGLVYLESAAPDPAPVPGPGWEVLKEKRVGDVRMQLLRRLTGVLPT